MTDEQVPGGPDATPELRLRPARPAVTRLSRKAIVGLGGTAAVAIIGLGFWALQANRKAPPQELYTTATRGVAEALSDLPRDYSGVPRPVTPLGPPLPGDLGRPILNAAGRGSATGQQFGVQEQDAARDSGLFFRTASQPAPPQTAEAGGAAVDGGMPGALPAVDAGSAQNMQDQKLAFLNGPADHETISADRLVAPASPYILQAGSVIPAALLTGLRSDLPGMVTAQVTEDVFDSPTGRFLLVPQGSKLIGYYDAHVAFGQSRVLLVWTRLILPDGSSIVLDRLPGADAEGYAGIEDRVDYHWGDLFKAALLSSILGIGANLGDNSNSQIVEALRNSGSQTLNQAGQQIVGRELNIQPTLTIRQGYPVRVMVNRDIVLAPRAE